jgi:hypothetical protein
MKILLAVDGSVYTKRMLAYLATHNELFSADNDYTVFTVQPVLPPHAKSSWKVGHVGETIAKFAESNKFEMVIMGSHGHGGLMKLVMGSVATQVLAQCHVPVLMVR